MKKLLLIGLFLLFSLPSFSQALENGVYKSNITIYSGETQKTYAYTFYVIGGVVSQVSEPAVSVTRTLGDTTVFSWLNSGGIWTESQTFVFTKNKTTGDLYVTTTRVVQNEGQEPWQTFGLGKVYKY